MNKKNNFKNKTAWYYFGFILTIILEVIFYIIFACGIIGTSCSFVYIWIYYIQKSCLLDSAIAAFGAFSAVSIIPLLSVAVSVVVSYKSLISEIENDLAKCQNMTIQFKKLPCGADLASARLLQAAIYEEYMLERQAKLSKCKTRRKRRKVYNEFGFPKKSLSDYYYQININFRQDLSEFYRISLSWLELFEISSGAANNYLRLPIRTIGNVGARPCVIKDISGTNCPNEGEQIYIFLDKEDMTPTAEEIESFLSGRNVRDLLIKRCVRFTLNFAKKDDSHSGALMFPMTRKIINYFLELALRRRQILGELEIRLTEKKDDNVAQAQIDDVSFTICRRLNWANYLKYKKAIIKHMDAREDFS